MKLRINWGILRSCVQPDIFNEFFSWIVLVTLCTLLRYVLGGKGPVHHGVCSTWLNSLQPGDKVACYVRQ